MAAFHDTDLRKVTFVPLVRLRFCHFMNRMYAPCFYGFFIFPVTDKNSTTVVTRAFIPKVSGLFLRKPHHFLIHFGVTIQCI